VVGLGTDRQAELYDHSLKYIKLARELTSDFKEVGEKLKDYAERSASLLEREGVLPTLAFIASRVGNKGLLEACAAEPCKVRERVRLSLKVGGDDLAHALIYNCYARWLLRFIPIERSFERDPTVIMEELVTRFADYGFKLRVMIELSQLAVALKHLATGEFG